MDNNNIKNDSYKDAEERGFGNFKKDDNIVVARTFLDKAETQLAASLLRVEKIPHFIADSNSTLFSENVLGGERLFVKEGDLDLVSVILSKIKENPNQDRVASTGQVDRIYSILISIIGICILAIVLFQVLENMI